MINSGNISAKLAIDSKSIDDLRLQAKQNPEQALKEVAQQFEAIFIHMMLKSMREALPKDGIFDSQQTQFYTQMLDQQLAQKMSASGIGLADMMVQQLTQATTQSLSNLNHTEAHGGIPGMFDPNHQSVIFSSERSGDMSRLLWPAGNPTQQVAIQPDKLITTNEEILTEPLVATNFISASSSQPENFVKAVWSHAKTASEATGIPAHFMIAQAALESGWGKHEIRYADNRPSFNLFGIKAGENWKGAVVETVTTEYINGVPEKMVEKFRAYSSYAEGFQDYANLLLNNPRYAAVLKNQDAAAFAHGLQKAGYATDPMYADKLIRIINSNTIKHPTI